MVIMKATLKDCVVEPRNRQKKYCRLNNIDFIFVNLVPYTKFYFQRTYFAHLN
jgi:hypothetical protein